MRKKYETFLGPVEGNQKGGRLPEKARGLPIQTGLFQITYLNQKGFQRQASMPSPSASGHGGNFLAGGHQLRHSPCIKAQGQFKIYKKIMKNMLSIRQ
jgi:hypothetical protein